LLDVISALTFRTPKYDIYAPRDISFWGLNKINDFNGDGRSELVIYEHDSRVPVSYPDSNWLTRSRGRHLIYNLGSKFDTLDYEVIETPADSLNLNTYLKYGDINNDGFTDLITKSSYTIGENHYVSRIFYGNNQRDFIADKFYTTKDSTTYYSKIIPFFDYNIVNDLNGDGKEDILMRDYKDLYPYYYGWGISYGGDSLNFDINEGVNTQNRGLDIFTPESGDFNGDGYGDILTKTGFENTSVVLYLGEPNPEPNYIAYKSYSDGWGIGRMVESVGDVNGDGADDFCIGDIENNGQQNCRLRILYIFAGDTSVVTSVKGNKNLLPKSFELSEAYPNPFNPSTIITYRLLSEAEVTIKLTNTLGQKVATLVKGTKKAGSYNLEINSKKHGLSSGVYFVNMIVNNNKSITKKIVLLK
jgi:hypothetical protein